MSEISSGLVAVAEVVAGFSLRWTEPDYGCSCKHYDKLVRLSDAEAIIAAKDAEIERLAIYKNLADEYGLSVFADLKELKDDRDTWKARAEFSFIQRDKQSAALKLAREALFDMQDSYAAVHGWKDSFVIAATTAIAAIDALGEVK